VGYLLATMAAYPVSVTPRADTGRFLAPADDLRDRDELYVLWSAARAEANIAYDAWRAFPGLDAYAAYRAAEDRADAAQDALAELVAA
jgi:hypothetical protein